jgi:hypothetical protein
VERLEAVEHDGFGPAELPDGTCRHGVKVTKRCDECEARFVTGLIEESFKPISALAVRALTDLNRRYQSDIEAIGREDAAVQGIDVSQWVLNVQAQPCRWERRPQAGPVAPPPSPT